MQRTIAFVLALTLICLGKSVWGQQPDERSPLGDLDYELESITDVKLDITDVQLVDGKRPEDLSRDLFSGPIDPARLRRDWALIEFNWAAANVYHQPLYFDDTPLERYGQSRHPVLQPWISGARFFMTFPAVPYLIGLSRPYDHVYNLGLYRPGSHAPPVRSHLPLEADAITLESAAWIALIFALP